MTADKKNNLFNWLKFIGAGGIIFALNVVYNRGVKDNQNATTATGLKEYKREVSIQINGLKEEQKATGLKLDRFMENQIKCNEQSSQNFINFQNKMIELFDQNKKQIK